MNLRLQDGFGVKVSGYECEMMKILALTSSSLYHAYCSFDVTNFRLCMEYSMPSDNIVALECTFNFTEKIYLIGRL